MAEFGRHEQGHVQRTSAGSSDVIATPGASHRLFIKNINVSISVVAASSTVALTDGTTTYWKICTADADGGVAWSINFGEKGFALPANKALKLTTTGNVTADAWASGYVRGRA